MIQRCERGHKRRHGERQEFMLPYVLLIRLCCCVLVIQAMASMISAFRDSNTINDISRIVDDGNSIKFLFLAVQHERRQAMNSYQHAMDEEHDQEMDEAFMVASNNTIRIAENIKNWEDIFETISKDRHFETQDNFITAIKSNQQNVTKKTITESEVLHFIII